MTAHTLSHRYVLTVDADGLLQFHMRTGGLIHSANANHSHPVTALGVGQVSAAAARSQPRAIYSCRRGSCHYSDVRSDAYAVSCVGLACVV